MIIFIFLLFKVIPLLLLGLFIISIYIDLFLFPPFFLFLLESNLKLFRGKREIKKKEGEKKEKKKGNGPWNGGGVAPSMNIGAERTSDRERERVERKRSILEIAIGRKNQEQRKEKKNKKR